MAHELGHRIIHKDYYPSNIDSIESYLQNLSEYRNSTAENQADVFAASLLVPREELRRVIKENFGEDLALGIREKTEEERSEAYMKILRHFGVSNMVLAKRIQDVFPDLMGVL